jgi:hypothetical protein
MARLVLMKFSGVSLPTSIVPSKASAAERKSAKACDEANRASACDDAVTLIAVTFGTVASVVTPKSMQHRAVETTIRIKE